jgi:hypothetical protein
MAVHTTPEVMKVCSQLSEDNFDKDSDDSSDEYVCDKVSDEE